MKLKNIFLVIVDTILISLAILLAFRVRFPDFASVPNFIAFTKYYLVFVIIKVISYYFFGLYGGIWKYAGLNDALRIFYAVTIGSMATASFTFFTQVPLIEHSPLLPRSVMLIDWFLNLLFVGSLRFFPRISKDFTKKPLSENKRLLIVGAGDTGEIVLREINKHPEFGYKAIGFIDDNPEKLGKRIHNLKVLGTREDIARMVESYHIDQIIIAISTASGEAVRQIVSYCQKSKVDIKIVPEISKIVSGSMTIADFRNVKAEDLLGRKTIKLNNEDTSAFIKNKRVLVTGAGGSIGSEICRHLVLFQPKQIILFEHNENDVYFLSLDLNKKFPNIEFNTVIGDIKDVGLLKNAFSKFNPQVVFHAAAHKHVPLMEENPASAIKNNIIGTRNLIYAAAHYNAESFVLISTDKAVNPTSIMGASKRIAEMILQTKAKSSKTKFMAVRFGNVIGSNGSVVELFKKQIAEGGPVTVTDPNVIRYFMTVGEAAQLVIQAGSIGKGGEIFILDMGEQMKIADLAKNLITLSGLEIDKDIFIKFTGLRPGEKLYEEILRDKERDRATKNEKIFVAQADTFNPEKLRKDVKDLKRFADLMDHQKVVKKIKEMVPNFKPDARWKLN